MAGNPPGDSGPADPGPADPDAVPPHIRRAWEEAEARLFPVVMVRPDLYERSLTLVRLTVDALRRECPDTPSLVARVDRADALVAAAAAGAALSTEELNLGLVAAAAFAMRYRELVTERNRRVRLARLTRAREEGVGWLPAEETGAEEHALAVPYWRLEVHVPTGAALLLSIEPDETLSRPVYRLEAGRMDLGTGRLALGGAADLPAREYRDRSAWEEAAAQARERLAAG